MSNAAGPDADALFHVGRQLFHVVVAGIVVAARRPGAVPGDAVQHTAAGPHLHGGRSRPQELLPLQQQLRLLLLRR